MAMDNVKFVEAISTILNNLIGKKMQVTGVPEEQWGKIRETFLNSQHGDHVEDASLANLRRIRLSQKRNCYLGLT